MRGFGLAAGTLLSASVLLAGDTHQKAFDEQVRPFVQKYCSACHNSRAKTAGVALDTFTSAESIATDNDVWEKVLRKLRTGEMPPRGVPRAPQDVTDRLVTWLGSELDRAAAAHPDPGRVVVHRLNRAEYNNAVRDLFGVEFQPADDFPADDSGYGFDNVADVLSVSPLLMEKYLSAAGKVSRLAIAKLPDGDMAAADGIARRAWRRPLTDAERARLRGFYNDGGLEMALRAILVSPNFLFRIERDPDGAKPGKAYPVTDLELASRLSFFLWSSIPDDRLLSLAERRRLHKSRVLAGEIRRMIRDPRARALTGNFAGQWLQLRNLTTHKPNPERFPEFDPELRTDMRRETELFFETIIAEDRSVLDFLDARFTFINARLAAFYGIPGVEGAEFRRVDLPDESRGGVLTMASVLTVSSYPTRTSPVIRGKWVLENLLGAPPPPPPPNVPNLKEAGLGKTVTVRQQLELHRASPACSSCHAKMDPIGFALENYDAIGRWRTHDGAQEIDSSGVLPSGEQFRNASEFKRILREHPEEFVLCFTEKLLTYALGRGVERTDKPVIRAIARDAASRGYHLSSIVQGIVNSAPFRMRRAAGKEVDRVSD